MASIFSVSDLRNYDELLKSCKMGKPLFLTENGKERFVILDIEDYERDHAEKNLLRKLLAAEASVKTDEDWLSHEDLKVAMESSAPPNTSETNITNMDSRL